MKSTMRRLAIVLFLFSALCRHSEARAQKTGKPKSAEQLSLIASIGTPCGSIDYFFGPTAKMASDELRSVREIISSLYDGGALTFTFPGGPAPKLDDESRKHILDTYYRKEELAKLKGPELEKELQEIHSLSPDYHKHRGPKPQELQKILNSATFKKRLGNSLVKLIERKIAGSKGGGEAFDKELSARFGVKVDRSNLHTDENCHVGESLGAYYN